MTPQWVLFKLSNEYPEHPNVAVIAEHDNVKEAILLLPLGMASLPRQIQMYSSAAPCCLFVSFIIQSIVEKKLCSFYMSEVFETQMVSLLEECVKMFQEKYLLNLGEFFNRTNITFFKRLMKVIT